MEPAVIAAIITGAAAIASVILSLMLREWLEGSSGPSERKRRLRRLTWTAGISAVSFFVLLTALFTVLAVTRERLAAARIIRPVEGERVDMREMVRGSYSGIDGDGRLRLVVSVPSVESRYYPQAEAARCMEGGRWTCPAFLGGSEDAGLEFDIIVVVADEEAERVFKEYLEESERRNAWTGMAELPSGAMILDSVSVTRN